MGHPRLNRVKKVNSHVKEVRVPILFRRGREIRVGHPAVFFFLRKRMCGVICG
jgi:hypothetical protein